MKSGIEAAEIDLCPLLKMQRLLKVLQLALLLLLVGMALVVSPTKEVGFQEKQHPSGKTSTRKIMLLEGTRNQHFAIEDADFPRRTLRHKDHMSPPSPLLNAHRGYGHGSYGGYGGYGHHAPPPPPSGGYGSYGPHIPPPPPPPLPGPMTPP